MRKVLPTITLVVSAIFFSGCDKSGVTRNEPVSGEEMRACAAAILTHEENARKVKLFADGALAGNREQAGLWYINARPWKRGDTGYRRWEAKMSMQDVAKVLRPPGAGDSAEYRALYDRYQACIKKMQQAGIGSGLPLVEAARLGVPDAQYELYKLLSNVVTRTQIQDYGIDMTYKSLDSAYARIWYANYSSSYSPPIVIDDEDRYCPPEDVLRYNNDTFPTIEVIEPPMALSSHVYVLDSDWQPPAGAWDPFYKDGKFNYKGAALNPLELLSRASAESKRYRARLAAVQFISSSSQHGREVAAKTLLSIAVSSDWPRDDVLCCTCLAAIHLRGVGSDVDRSKAVEVMLGSASASLISRGILLACREGIPLSPDVTLPARDDRRENDLPNAACHQFGVGYHERDLEKAYFYYFRSAYSQRFASPDLKFSLSRMSEIERQLAPDALLALQKNCGRWVSKWSDVLSPTTAEWRDRYSADQQQPR